ncbi:DoxX-like family protein [Rhizosphaericola mali]|uniref:DoxX family protein n=1 Tax=Rhizosphaericola mali TaxID=2545455 RepID=A0A5P2FWH0_9BACT|nr:DoxX-like family protein [Rhizosphaericola mali]QES87876.1 hypothetical protein E0W69_004095 [Rhizosphaericola mali]
MKILHKTLTYLIALVWLINGLYCKVLNFTPRHQEIVGRILGNEHSRLLTIQIGISEIFMSVWIISRFKPNLNTTIQIIIIATMNVIEFCLAPDLLLWEKMNIVFAFLFIVIIYLNEFILTKKMKPLPEL